MNMPTDTTILPAGAVAVLGVPWDEQSSYLRGAAQAPARIWEAFRCPSTNLSTESGLDLGHEPRLVDAGEVALGAQAPRSGVEQIEQAAAGWLGRGARLLALGGDHAITYPLVRAHHAHYPQLNLLHIDAHSDLYDEFEGHRLSHACPFARIMEAGLATRLVQVGLRTLTPHQRQQAARFGVEQIEMKDWRPGLALDFTGPLYLSLDLDGLDPAFAPGVSHPEPGGFSTRDVIRLIQSLRAPLVGADLVELNPTRDPAGLTAMVAAKLMKEMAAKMLQP